jgi:hypothetical protein
MSSRTVFFLDPIDFFLVVLSALLDKVLTAALIRKSRFFEGRIPTS